LYFLCPVSAGAPPRAEDEGWRGFRKTRILFQILSLSLFHPAGAHSSERIMVNDPQENELAAVVPEKRGENSQTGR